MSTHEARFSTPRLTHAATPRTPGVPSVVIRLATWLAAVSAARQQRKALMKLDDHSLKDIGLSRADVVREASRRFWDTAG